ncbi:MAG: twin-arginine translocase TatA/TatE family subunit [Bacteroidales bacterium]|nr:twin-arginine translocase TatA/TatE family subunit [Bacteroidales bacterium]
MLIYPLFVGMTELIIILCIVLLIFGGKKIPELMKGVGKGVRSFKEGLNEIDEQVQPSEKKEEEKK